MLLGLEPRFADRRDAGRQLVPMLERERGPSLVVVGLARGGVEVAAEIARPLDAPLDAVAVRKIGHPWQPEYALGAATPGGGVYVRGRNGLTEEQLDAVVADTAAQAAVLDRRLHADLPALDLAGKTAVLVDDGLATGATMIAAVRWARAAGATRLVAAVPVASMEGLDQVRHEADAMVCVAARLHFFAVGVWYASFPPVDDAEVVELIARSRARKPARDTDVRALALAGC